VIKVDFWLPDPAAILAPAAFDAGALISIERADLTGDPPALGDYAEVHTLAVVADQLQYGWWDPDGLATSSYRWRATDAGESIFSPYSATFAGTNPAGAILSKSYATLDQALTLYEQRPPASRIRRLADALGVATSELIVLFEGRDYFRHPAQGVDIWLASEVDVDGLILHVHEGIVALDKLELRGDRGASWTETTDYVLRGSGPYEPLDAGANEPAFHIQLTKRQRFPNRSGSIRLTGARGWPAIPGVLAEGCAERARSIAYADGSYAGSVAGPDEIALPGPTGPDRWPHVLYQFLTHERQRFAACMFAND
jgi:hypothetical protein